MFTSNRTWFCKGLEKEKAKELADKLTTAIANGDHQEAGKIFSKLHVYVKRRIDENYFTPIEKINSIFLSELDVPENTAFITMSICCILIEFYFEMVNGYDESKDSGYVVNAYKTVLPLLDQNISETMAAYFYKGIRCGILHQGQTKENTALTYERETIFEQNGPYYLSNPSTVFKRLKVIYGEYWRNMSMKNYYDEEGEKLIKKINYILSHIE